MVSVRNTHGQYIVQETIVAYFEDLRDVSSWESFMKSKGYQVVVPEKFKAIPLFNTHIYEASASRTRTRRTITFTVRKKIARKF